MTIEKIAVDRDPADKVSALRRLRDIDRTVANSASDIRGRMVHDKDGQGLGKIEALLIDDDRNVRFMEVASGGFLGLGQAKSLIPVEAITRITEDDVYISHTREHVAGAPSYDPDLVAAHAADFLSSVYPYYGYQANVSVDPLVEGYPFASLDGLDLEARRTDR